MPRTFPQPFMTATRSALLTLWRSLRRCSSHNQVEPWAYLKDLLERLPTLSKSGYYRPLKAQPGPRAQRTERIHAAVKQVFDQSFQTFGSIKIANELQKRDDLESACRNTAAKAMREIGLKSKVFRKFKPTTTQVDPTKLPAPNILNQEFEADSPNQKWVTDITYLSTLNGWGYLAVIIDLFSRKVVGWSISESLATPLVSEALRKAIESRRPDTSKLLHHSDRGCQYTSDEYQMLSPLVVIWTVTATPFVPSTTARSIQTSLPRG